MTSPVGNGEAALIYQHTSREAAAVAIAMHCKLSVSLKRKVGAEVRACSPSARVSLGWTWASRATEPSP